ncbi:MAG: winged helix-turn-helix transcriptional regulator [Candidatus Hodarchaeota archaeon]
MDSIDKGILLDLTKNCRSTYESLAQKFDLSATAVRQRVINLIDVGVIQEFTVYLTPAMVGTEHIYALLSTDGSRSDDLIDEIGEYPNVLLAGFLSTDTCSVYADYVGNSDLSKLTAFLRNLEGVTDVKVHHLLVNPGHRMEFKRLHLRVLGCLYRDPRMSAADIAAQTGLTTRRARRALQQLAEGNAICFTIRWNPNATDSTAFMSEIHFDESKVNAYDTLDNIKEMYPQEFCEDYSWISAAEPIVFAVFLVDHIRRAEHITHDLRASSFITSINTLIPYPTKKYDGVRRRRLREILEEAGVL